MIGFLRFLRMKWTDLTVTEPEPQDRFDMLPPHCDQSILHEPGVCEFCDRHPEWQEYRILSRINFTGENDPDKAPCPSLHFRSAEKRDRWGGNVPNGSWLPRDVLDMD